MFALLGIVIFYFAWDPTAVAAVDLAPGVLWAIFTFSGLLGLQRSFGIEQADRAIDALLGAPIPRESIYLGKAMANLVFVAAVQIDCDSRLCSSSMEFRCSSMRPRSL